MFPASIDKPQALRLSQKPQILSYDFTIKMKRGDRVVTTIRLPDDLYRKLKKEAEKKGMTFNAYVLSILWNRRRTEIEIL